MDTNAVARAKATVIDGRTRFTVLTERMIRMEWSGDGMFEDRPSLAVVNRHLPVPPFTVSRRGDTIQIQTAAITLTYRGQGAPFSRSNLSCRFAAGGVRGEWVFGRKDSRNLGGTLRTLDNMDGEVPHEWKPDANGVWGLVAGKAPAKVPPGLVSRSGWSLLDDSRSVVLDPAGGKGVPWVTPRPEGRRQDLYFMAYGQDYRGWVREAALVFGRQPLAPRFTLGYWYSRYWAYTDRELEDLVQEFNRAGVPLDVLVIDMDWHKPGWTGYSWDRGYFPDPDEHLRWLKKQGLKVTLNLHPADGVGDQEDQFDAVHRHLGGDRSRLIRKPLLSNDVVISRKRIAMDMTDPKYVEAYFKYLHHPQERKGVDFWWMDWQQGLKTKIEGLDPLPWINHLHWTDMAANPERRGKRPLCFSRYGGLGAGRYPVGFSGDTHSTWKSLAYQPGFTADAANVLYGYWSHDIGGHMFGNLTPELYTRWIQFGAFSPILRSHSSKSMAHDRRFWNFPEPYRGVMREAVRQRYAWVPYLYSENRRCYDTGLSLCRPMYYHHPGEEDAYRHRNQYYCGESVLVAPVVTPAEESTGLAAVDVWLPKGKWFDGATGEMLAGGKVHRRMYTIAEVPHYVRPGTILPGQLPAMRLEPGSYAELVATCFPGGNGAYDLYEDDGVSEEYRSGQYATIPFAQQEKDGRRVVAIGPARGTFTGFLARRGMEIRFPVSVPPEAVRAGGRLLRWKHRLEGTGWSYDGQSATVIVRLEGVNLRRKTVVELVGNPSSRARSVSGLAGLLRRLGTVAEYTKLVSPCFPMHKDERLAVWAAQTGNRVSRDPESLARELAGLRRSLQRLPAALKEFEALYRKANNREAAGYLARAGRILKACVAGNALGLQG